MKNASEIPELESSWDSSLLHTGQPNLRRVIRNAWKRHFGNKCPACGVMMHFEARFSSHKHFATIDHIKARSHGGTDALDNIQVICRKCNNDKSKSECILT